MRMMQFHFDILYKVPNELELRHINRNPDQDCEVYFRRNYETPRFLYVKPAIFILSLLLDRYINIYR